MTKGLGFFVAAVLVLVGSAGDAAAKVRTQLVEYKDGDVTLEGYLAFDDASSAKKPGILIVHDWLGISAETKRRAEMIAQLGYVAFAADIYGKGIRPTDGKAGGAEAGKWKGNRPGLRSRARAGLDVLAGHKRVDPTKLAAMGYCFGGTTALELARSGAPLIATITFHGGLDTPNAADAKNIKGKVLALHGGDDPFVPAEQVNAFEKEMREGGVDWQLVAFGGAVHSFTNPGAGSDNSKGAAYNEKADKRSWEQMRLFLANEAFPKR